MNNNRKIIHVDMDAFYASIEQRDRPELRGKPVIVGGLPDKRGVVATCSYEARKFGIHSAMASKRAYELCPQAIFVAPRFDVYKATSAIIMQLFLNYTDVIEPLALDEAYLDVTDNKPLMISAAVIAKDIQREIYKQTSLTASAGVSFNKFLAKTASGYNKPNGITVISPEKAIAFIEQLAIGKFYGVGKVTERRMHELGIHTGADLKEKTEQQLVQLFKDRGRFLYQVVRGEDNRPVTPDRKRKSLGNETTFDVDSDNEQEIMDILYKLAERSDRLVKRYGITGTTLTLKIKYFDFKSATRSITINEGFESLAVIMNYLKLLYDNAPDKNKKIRLVGVYLSNFKEEKTTPNSQLFLPF